MKEFSIKLDYDYKYDELFEYLYCFDGIENVIVSKDNLLDIYVNYNENIINEERIKLEILAFLNLLNYPSIYGFNRYSKEENIVCKRLKHNICCEFCFGNILEILYDTPEIVKVESDFYDKFWCQNRIDNKYFIMIYYNKDRISEEKLSNLEKEISIYG